MKYHLRYTDDGVMFIQIHQTAADCRNQQYEDRKKRSKVTLDALLSLSQVFNLDIDR